MYWADTCSIERISCYFKGLMPQEIFTDMKQTLGESAPTYSKFKITKWYSESRSR